MSEHEALEALRAEVAALKAQRQLLLEMVNGSDSSAAELKRIEELLVRVTAGGELMLVSNADRMPCTAFSPLNP